MGRPKSVCNSLTQSELDVIHSLAQNGLNKAKTAKELHYHWNSVDYIVKRIKFKTGLNPTDFYNMIKLVELAKGIHKKPETNGCYSGHTASDMEAFWRNT